MADRTIAEELPAGHPDKAYWRHEDIAAYCGVQHGTSHRWLQRGLLPEPADRAGHIPLWTPASIIAWAEETDRAPTP